MEIHTRIVDTQKNGITFILFVEYFGIKYKDISNELHLLDALKPKYTISTDW